MYVQENHLEQLRTLGYFTLKSVMSHGQVESLRADCDRLLLETQTRMEGRGQLIDGLNVRGKRFFLDGHYRECYAMMEFVHSPLMVEIAGKVLGQNAFLFVEEFVVKMPTSGSELAWHQDSGYIPYAHKPYLSCWCALDGMSEANGTLYILPYESGRMPEVLPHRHDAATGEDVGYTGASLGTPVVVPAGSVVVFSSRLLHRSGDNVTGLPRRSYLVQYSAEPIMSADGSRLRNIADPVIVDGLPVGVPAAVAKFEPFKQRDYV